MTLDELRKLAEAQSEVAALKHDIARHIQIAADLAQENDGLRKDAWRYRWLRTRDSEWSVMFTKMIDPSTAALECGLTYSELDSAIDAAMKEGK